MLTCCVVVVGLLLDCAKDSVQATFSIVHSHVTYSSHYTCGTKSDAENVWIGGRIADIINGMREPTILRTTAAHTSSASSSSYNTNENVLDSRNLAKKLQVESMVYWPTWPRYRCHFSPFWSRLILSEYVVPFLRIKDEVAASLVRLE